MRNALRITLITSLLLICYSRQIIADGCGSYCVAKPEASDELIQKALDYCCGKKPEICDDIQTGKPCFVPGDLRATASYVFDSWFKANVGCDFEGAATIVSNDPSHGDCKYKCKNG
ncbi:major pollen allergen Ole e 10-like [Chenopodium quinoa]|uniref:major pollen allergen Ole e 10-like n=1 Tax=Chenopodium quinoa TaxID=63459 RepID=UPI000B78BF27|nr:major pollen allergen Ole e 10-like [Chenopodium quinoa]